MMKPSAITRDLIGCDLLARYTGSAINEFQPYILLTNFEQYVNIFAEITQQKISTGLNMSVCHDDKSRVSIINYGVGSPVAALIAELLSFITPKATLMLGMCGGLREGYVIGDYFNPVAAIRGEGTSLIYLPERCPSLSSFVIQRYVCEELERKKISYHTGIIHTTNIRFWEFKEDFKKQLIEERAQAIDMECATLFTVGFTFFVPIGALMLISDLPLTARGIKTKEMSNTIFREHATTHVRLGISVLSNMFQNEKKGFGYHF